MAGPKPGPKPVRSEAPPPSDRGTGQPARFEQNARDAQQAADQAKAAGEQRRAQADPR
jgi:hypothetical protein